MALDDSQTEELMIKVRGEIEVCIHKLKQSFDEAYPRKTDESVNIMEQRISDLNNEKENLLNLFSQQETSYKSSIDLNHKEASKLKELLRKTLETKSALEAKVKSLESSLQESIECIDSLKAEGSKLIASFQEQIQEKDYLLTSSVQESDLKINLLQTSVTTLENQINSDRLEFENKYSEFTKEQKSLQDSLKIAEERLKLKEEEIFEIKENYEAQLEDLLTEEEKESLQKPDMLRIIPLDGAKSSSNASFKHDDEKKRYNLKIRELQEKVHNLCDKLQNKVKYLINQNVSEKILVF